MTQLLSHLVPSLPRLRIDLRRRSLRAHFALNAPRLSPRSSSRTLSFLCLLLALAFRLLLLAFLNRGLAGSGPGFGALCAAFFDYFEGGTNDATLGFDSAASALFGDFL